MRKVGQSVIIKKKLNIKKNYRKIGMKKDNDVDADMTQLECSNNKFYSSALLRSKISQVLC